MPKVFIINEPRAPKPRGTQVVLQYDVTPAREFGEIVYVFKNADMRMPSRDPVWAVKRAQEVLEQMRPDDFITSAGGDPVGIFIAAAVAAEYLDGKVNYLKWERGADRTSGYYVPVKLDVFSGLPIPA